MQVFYATLSHWDENKDIEHLAPHRKPKMQRYVQTADRLRCLVGWLLVQYALGDIALTTPKLTEYGKPYYGNSLHFNLSHSGEYVAVAVGDHELGMDVEQIATYSLDVAQKCFNAQELDWIKICQIHSDIKGGDAFYALWTAKESLMKATALGFYLPPTSFDVLLSLKHPHIPCTISGNNWFLYQKKISEHMFCVASLEECAQIQWNFLSRDAILNTTAHKESSNFFS